MLTFNVSDSLIYLSLGEGLASVGIVAEKHVFKRHEEAPCAEELREILLGSLAAFLVYMEEAAAITHSASEGLVFLAAVACQFERILAQQFEQGREEIRFVVGCVIVEVELIVHAVGKTDVTLGKLYVLQIVVVGRRHRPAPAQAIARQVAYHAREEVVARLHARGKVDGMLIVVTRLVRTAPVVEVCTLCIVRTLYSSYSRHTSVLIAGVWILPSWPLQGDSLVVAVHAIYPLSSSDMLSLILVNLVVYALGEAHYSPLPVKHGIVPPDALEDIVVGGIVVVVVCRCPPYPIVGIYGEHEYAVVAYHHVVEIGGSNSLCCQHSVGIIKQAFVLVVDGLLLL